VSLDEGLLERQDAVASVRELVSRVADGQAGAIFLVGEAGLGKTSLIDLACRLAGSAGLTVGAGRGDPMETGLPFGLVAQALEAAGGGGNLGQKESSFPADKAARFYQVLRWLGNRPGPPLFLAVDDAHWADADSLALLSFLCRRMGQVPFGLIISARPWPPEARDVIAALVHDGCGTSWRLGPLSETATGELLEARMGRPLPTAARRRAFEMCAGNPLLLEQLAVAAGASGQVPEVSAAGAGALGAGMLLTRFAGLPEPGMRCAQAASVLGASFQPDVAVELAGLADSDAALAIEALGRAGLIRQRPGAAAEFVHPLLRQALYEDLAGPVRARLHGRAFTMLHARGMDAQAAEHAMLAGLTGDPAAASVLEDAGRRARRGGAVATAVTWFDAAVAMAGERASLGLLLARAEARLASGEVAVAVDSYRRLLTRPDLGGTMRVEALWTLGRALAVAGDHDGSAVAIAEALDITRDHAPATAVDVLLDAVFWCFLSRGPAQARPLAALARELAGPLDQDVRTRADAAWGEVTLLCGDPAGMAAAESAAPWVIGARRPGSGGTPESGWARSNSFAYCAILVERFEDADRAFTLARAAAEKQDAPEAIAGLAVGHSYALARMGRFDDALAAVNVAVALEDLVSLVSYAAVGSAYIQLHRGELDESARWCERVAAGATARGELNAQLHLAEVLGHRRLREGAVGEASEHYARLEEIIGRMGIGEPCLPPWPRHAIEAYLAAGRIADAERVLAWVERAAAPLPCRFPRIAAATGRAWLAEARGDYEAAEAHFSAALALHGEVDLPLEHAETLLAYGAFLRRSGRQAAARRLLARAVRIAEATGARWLASVAHEELKVAGGRLRQPAAPGTLSAQEERVARLAAAGASNPDIALQLSLSVHTIETHLEHVYAKLGIHTRYQLIAMAPQASWGRGGQDRSSTVGRRDDRHQQA
jgi:DNA-binding CsgD family transcriptional regulator